MKFLYVSMLFLLLLSFLPVTNVIADIQTQRVIIEMNVIPMTATERRNEKIANEYKKKLLNSKQQVLAKLTASKYKYLKVLKYTRYMSMQVDQGTLKQISADPNVKSVHVDSLKVASLLESAPLVGAISADLCDSNTCGAGQTIAILDTGIDSAHPFFAGKILGEACFSTTFATFESQSVCPNRQPEQFGPGAGVSCNIEGCDHGTHVAGIAVGNGNRAEVGFSGIAPEANVIPIQVFSRFNDNDRCESLGLSNPCLLAYTSDILSALEYVYDNRQNFNVSAVNLSLGGGQNASVCDTDVLKEIADMLRADGVAVVAASGNDGSKSAISSPACISSVISVGSVTKQDIVSSFSNSSDFLDLLAPGSFITSSVPGNSYAIMSGTSMATPHVSAAFALLRHKYPDSSIDELLELLKSSDTSIIDVNGVRTSRIRLDSELFTIKTIQAMEALVPAMPIYFYFIQFLLLLIIFYWLISSRIAR